MSDDRTPEQAFRDGIHEERRPWGRFRQFPNALGHNLKIITVEPGGVLSLQYHRRRSEYWVVLDEGLEVTVGDRVWRPARDEEIVIPCGAVHRLRNTGAGPGRVMEVWIGESAEEDVVRVSDDYGRAG